MKKTNIVISSALASVCISGLSVAGQSCTTAAQSATTPAITSYLEVSAVTGEESVNFADSSASEILGSGRRHVSGVRLDGGLGFGNGFSLDGRYQYVEDKFNDSKADIRALLNYTQAVAPGVAAFFGAGYGHQRSELFGPVASQNSDAVLANVGVEFTSGQFFGSATYTYAFTTSSEITINPILSAFAHIPAPEAKKVDIGTLEARLGYHLTKQLSAVASLGAQLNGDSLVNENWLAGLGLRFSL